MVARHERTSRRVTCAEERRKPPRACTGGATNKPGRLERWTTTQAAMRVCNKDRSKSYQRTSLRTAYLVQARLVLIVFRIAVGWVVSSGSRVCRLFNVVMRALHIHLALRQFRQELQSVLT